jgi:hypothetical protein
MRDRAAGAIDGARGDSLTRLVMLATLPRSGRGTDPGRRKL